MSIRGAVLLLAISIILLAGCGESDTDVNAGDPITGQVSPAVATQTGFSESEFEANPNLTLQSGQTAVFFLEDAVLAQGDMGRAGVDFMPISIPGGEVILTVSAPSVARVTLGTGFTSKASLEVNASSGTARGTLSKDHYLLRITSLPDGDGEDLIFIGISQDPSSRATTISISENTCRNCSLVSIDLSNKDLSGVDLEGSVLVFANLRGANFQRANLTGCDFSSAKMEDADLTNAVISDAYLGSARATRCNFTGVTARGAEFARAELGGAVFESANLTGASLSSARGEGATFDRANLSGAFFSSTALTASNFRLANLNGTRVSSSNLSNSNFVDAVIVNSIIEFSNLSGCDFTRAVLQNNTVRDNDVTGAIFPPN